ncbi:N-terminal acetyltransferase A, auxiliary subunit [Thelephora ganbajun]|uniref:N-terminal acetyltransferase A, auxiliary subunit n=1 Tax=Thelephora ganbajun TaxID=370292 RepID=A0ACB6ZT32_THEGA|nr:N-terminal acetyltransferase A, auxiliary subunit [Thelephora ganbajun]
MPPPSLPIPAKRALPSKEATLFRELLTLYETRQLKKGLKTADLILKKYPEHGETLCMKGLLLTHMGRREEGIDLVKKGMRFDLTSHICWHVFGLIQKGEKNYEEALKSYTQALRFDKENLNILRDSAHLQTQLRIFDALVETRHTLLRLRPNLRQNWVALAVAYHLNGELDEARKVLEQYESILKDVPDYDVEHSEMLLYHVALLEEVGQFSEALSLLDTNAKARLIIDRTAVMERRARLLTKLGNVEEAEHAWKALIQQNSDCRDYYKGYLSIKGVDLDTMSEEARQETVRILRTFSEQPPKATVPRRLALEYSKGDEFKELVEPYLFSGLSKGIPSLFVDLKDLYKDQDKQRVIEELVEDASSSSTPSEPPTTYLWSLYFLSQHYLHLRQYSRALNLLDIAISHTPTLPELYTCKARVLKRSGDTYGAAQSLNDARLLDLQDRFLNTKCAKYRLRAGLSDEAQEIFGLFTKKDAPTPASDLEDMQSLMFLTEDGDSHNRSGRLAMALKRYVAVQKTFNEFEDDQYDFHGYSLRKFTINIYMNLVSWEDQARSHPAHVHAAIEGARIFVRVHDNPALRNPQASSGQLTDAGKKAKKRAKKAAQKIQEDPKKTATSANEDKGLEAPAPKDDDPDGTKLLASSEGLEIAAKLLQPLVNLELPSIRLWVTVYDVAVRRKKYLQAVKALLHASTLDPADPEVHVRLVEIRKLWSILPQPPAAPIGSTTSEILEELIPSSTNLETYNAEYLQRGGTSASIVLSAAKASQVLGAPEDEVSSMVFNLFNPDVNLSIKISVEALSYLKVIHSPRVDEFRSRLDSKFELSTIFKPSSEFEAYRKQAIGSSFDMDGGEYVPQ